MRVFMVFYQDGSNDALVQSLIGVYATYAAAQAAMEAHNATAHPGIEGEWYGDSDGDDEEVYYNLALGRSFAATYYTINTFPVEGMPMRASTGRAET